MSGLYSPILEQAGFIKRKAAQGIEDLIKKLFANSEQGVWYDPSDLSTLFQDAAGTTPVTSDGDPVGLMLDKSGNGNHATQSVSTSRPVYKTDGLLHWLEFDGVDDWMRTGIVALSASSEFLVAGGVKDNTTGLMVYFESGTIFLSGGFGLFLNDRGKETAAVSSSTHFSSVIGYQSTAQVNKVQILYGDLSTSAKGRLNGVQASDAATSGGVFEDRDIYIGARGGVSKYLNGKIYGLVRATTGNETDMLSIESYLANKSGVTL